MDIFALPIFAVLREVVTFAFVVGCLAFLACEAYAKRGGDGRQRDAGPRTAGLAGPAMAGALAGVAALVAGFHLTEPLWG